MMNKNPMADKSQDKKDNNYFSHNSPVYGTPFNMIKNFGISYITNILVLKVPNNYVLQAY